MRELFETHDALVLVVALALLGGGAALAARAERPPLKTYDANGLTMDVPAAWLREPVEGGVQFRGEDAITRLEIRQGERAEGPGITLDAQLELERGRTHGQLYQRLSSDKRTVHGKQWLRTEYAYALAPAPDHAPRIATAVELAGPSSGRLWVVTLCGAEQRVRELEPWVLSSVEVKP